jgi:Flp pilus assembly protein protease CpaA
MDIAFIVFSLPICIADLRNYVIPNIYNKLLFYLTFVFLCIHGIRLGSQVLAMLVILCLLQCVGTGMGDLKLFALISLTHSFSPIEFIAKVFVLATVHIVILTGIERTIPSKIALAPSIFIGLATYSIAR